MIAVESFSAVKHYDIVCEWWRAQKWPPVLLSHLPPTGIMVTSDGVPAACAWIYKTDSAFCLLEWVVANPEFRHEKRASILSVLLSTSKMIAQTMGFKTIFTNTESEPLSKRLESHGFGGAGKGINFMCHLGGL